MGEEKKESAGSFAPPAPIFHVDIHGKMDSKDNLDLDIGLSSLHKRTGERSLDVSPGMGPMENCWAARGDSEKHAEFVALKEVGSREDEERKDEERESGGRGRGRGRGRGGGGGGVKSRGRLTMLCSISLRGCEKRSRG